MINQDAKTISPNVIKDLLDPKTIGKCQQDLIIGCIYKGASAYVAYKAGGNDIAQLAVTKNGVAITNEKYTICL